MLRKILNFFIHSVLRRFLPGFEEIETEEDIDFISEILVEGAREGHFHPDHLQMEIQETFKHGLRSIATKQLLTRMTERGGETVKAIGFLFGTKKTNYGFTILAEKEPGCTEYELYLGGIAKEYRGRGYGSKMHDHLFKFFPKNITYFARCYPDSEVMYQLLLRRGFEHISTSPTEIRHLERRPL